MRTKIAIAAIATAATAASAQNFSLEFVAPTTVDATAQSSFEVMVVAGGPGTHNRNTNFQIDGTDSSGAVAGMSCTGSSWLDDNQDNTGWLGGASYGPILTGQTVLPGVPGLDPDPSSLLPGAVVGVFTIDLTGLAGTIDFQLASVSGSAYTVLNIDLGGAVPLIDDTQAGSALSLGSATVTVIPAPASAALLGLGGLAATRRRR